MSNSNLPVQSGQNIPSSLSAAGNVFNTRTTALNPIYYSQRVTGANPCAFVLLVDQSGSMSEKVKDNGGNVLSKAEHLSSIVNKFLDEILTTCQKTDGVKNYFEIIIVGYGQLNDNNKSIINVVWEGELKGKSWVTVTELKNSPLRTEIVKRPNPSRFGKKEIEEPRNIWLEAIAEGLTPMQEALKFCHELLEDWARNNPNSFPPIIFNITDGCASDVNNMNEIVEVSDKIKSISTNDGNVLLFNCLLTDNYESLKEFPLASEISLFEDNVYELALFNSSSSIPTNLKKLLPSFFPSDEETKGLVLGNIDSVIRFLNIGTYTLQNIAN